MVEVAAALAIYKWLTIYQNKGRNQEFIDDRINKALFTYLRKA